MLPHLLKNKTAEKLFNPTDSSCHFNSQFCLPIQRLAADAMEPFSHPNLLHEKP